MSVNKVTLLGHTGKAPDFKEFDNGGCVATITRATNPGAYRMAKHSIAKRFSESCQSVR